MAPSPYRVRRLRREDGSHTVTLLGPDGVVDPVDRMIADLELLGNRSYHSLVASCHDLKQWFTFLQLRGLAWDRVTWQGDEALARFVSWLRHGDALEARMMIVPVTPSRLRQEATIQRVLGSVYAFYEHHPATRFSQGMDRRASSGTARWGSRAPRPVQVKVPGRAQDPSVLTSDQVALLKAACLSKRDLLIVTLMVDRGMRSGAVLGLRHEDVDTRRRLLRIVPRSDNANGARAKTDRVWELPITEAIADLHADYMFGEYGDLDSDHVFVSTRGATRGRALSYAALQTVFEGLSRRSGVPCHPHMLRHTFATETIARGVPIGVVQAMLTHKHASTTMSTYVHLQAEHLRGWLDGGPGSYASGAGALPSTPEIKLLLDGVPTGRV